MRVIFVALILLSGCATHRPIVDMQGVDTVKYNDDLVQCQNYAQQIDPASHAAAGAVTGAFLGAVIGAIFCGRNCAAQVGASTAIYAGAATASKGMDAQRDIVRRCMGGRGYKVLH